jgi:putative lipase involved disintegration of autophagic bodies
VPLMLSTLPNTLGLLIASFLWPLEHPNTPSLTFQLRHQHGITNNTLIVLSDVPQPAAGLRASGTTFTVKTQDVTTHRPTSFMGWDAVNVPGPNITDRETLLQLALMTSNAYEQEPSSKDWYDLGPDWNSVRVLMFI